MTLTDLPLFPLQSVLFPLGRLSLRIFEARYLDLMSRCLVADRPFGVVCLQQGSEVRQAGQTVRFEPVGVLARLLSADSDQPGVLKAVCLGGARFRWTTLSEQANGLWVATQAERLPDDPHLPLAAPHQPAAQALARALTLLAAREGHSSGPMHLDDTAWVANRWCELLPIPLAARQKLMELTDPAARMDLVDRFLRDKQLLQG